MYAVPRTPSPQTTYVTNPTNPTNVTNPTNPTNELMQPMNQSITPGISHEMTFEVTPEYSAAHIGSGTAQVLSTPCMILFMERTAQRLLAQHLPEGYTSVGTLVNVRHLAATPVGETVRVRAEVLAVDGRRVTLAVDARDSRQQIGAGQHERFIVNEARFLQKVTGEEGD